MAATKIEIVAELRIVSSFQIRLPIVWQPFPLCVTCLSTPGKDQAAWFFFGNFTKIEPKEKTRKYN